MKKKSASLFIVLLAVFSLMNRFSRMERAINRIVNSETSPYPQYEVYTTMQFDDRELEFCKEINEIVSYELVIKENEEVHHNIYRFTSRDFKQQLYFDWDSLLEIKVNEEIASPKTDFLTSGNVTVSVYVFDYDDEVLAKEKETEEKTVLYQGKEEEIVNVSWEEIDTLINTWEKTEMPQIIFHDVIVSVKLNEYNYEFASNMFYQKEWKLTKTDKEGYEDYVIVTQNKAQAYRLTNTQKEQLNQLLIENMK